MLVLVSGRRREPQVGLAAEERAAPVVGPPGLRLRSHPDQTTV